MLEAYLPQRLTGQEIADQVRAIVTEFGLAQGRDLGPGDMGKVMGLAKTRLAGKADMGQLSAAVKSALTR